MRLDALVATPGFSSLPNEMQWKAMHGIIDNRARLPRRSSKLDDYRQALATGAPIIQRAMDNKRALGAVAGM